MPFPTFLGIAFARSQASQKRQGPGASGPRNGGHQQQADPTQAARLHEMRVGTAYRIAVDAFGLDPFPTATLDRIVDAQHNRTGGHEPFYQQSQQKTARFTATPTSTAQNTMIVDEVAISTAAHHPQATGDGALARSEYGAGQKHLGVPPNRIGKQASKGVEERQEQRR